MRKLFLLMAAAALAAGAGCSSNPCGGSSCRLGNLFGSNSQPTYSNYGACCETPTAYSVPVMQPTMVQQPTVVQQPCCGN